MKELSAAKLDHIFNSFYEFLISFESIVHIYDTLGFSPDLNQIRGPFIELCSIEHLLNEF